LWAASGPPAAGELDKLEGAPAAASAAAAAAAAAASAAAAAGKVLVWVAAGWETEPSPRTGEGRGGSKLGAAKPRIEGAAGR